MTGVCLHVPLVAKMSRGLNTAQFASTLSILSASGVPLVEAMKIAGQVLSNSWLKLKVHEATVKVSEGASLHVGTGTEWLFPADDAAHDCERRGEWRAGSYAGAGREPYAAGRRDAAWGSS